MRNLNFLARILSSNNHYWIVAKRNEGTGRGEHYKDSIILIGLPHNVNINIDRKNIMLVDLEKLNSSSMDSNIFLNHPYAPFQVGMNFYDLYDGFPIDGDGIKIKDVMIKALSIKSDSLYEYKTQLKELLEPNTNGEL